jgi:glycosyltransferase involved in cell wall biosynthesis
LNICLVSREYPTDDHAGGIGTYTEKTARALARLGESVAVITESSGEATTRVEDGVTVHRLAPAETTPLGRVPNARTLARSRMVASAIGRLDARPDVVQACEFASETFWYSTRPHPGTSLVTRLATPTFLLNEISPGSGGSPLKARLLGALERAQTRRSDAVISPSDSLADVVSARWRIPRCRITTARTGVDFRSRYAERAEALPEELRGRRYLLYVGRLEVRKGLHILAQAMPEVLAAYPDLHFVFVGNNFLTYRGRPMQAYLEELNAPFAGRLRFYSRLRQTVLYPILANALFTVFPSLWESVPNVALEALDMGKPVVATTGCGFGEVVEDGRSGVLVPGGDVDALRGALLALLADRGRIERMSRAAAERAADFSLERVAERLLDFYRELRGVGRDGAPVRVPA